LENHKNALSNFGKRPPHWCGWGDVVYKWRCIWLGAGELKEFGPFEEVLSICEALIGDVGSLKIKMWFR
jgi:hypothetical protein